MTTKLERALKREVLIDGAPYILTIDSTGLKLVAKRKRKGYELDWRTILDGVPALANGIERVVGKGTDASASHDFDREGAEEK